MVLSRTYICSDMPSNVYFSKIASIGDLGKDGTLTFRQNMVDRKINYDNGIKIPFNKTKFKIAPTNSVLLCIELFRKRYFLYIA